MQSYKDTFMGTMGSPLEWIKGYWNAKRRYGETEQEYETRKSLQRKKVVGVGGGIGVAALAAGAKKVFGGRGYRRRRRHYRQRHLGLPVTFEQLRGQKATKRCGEPTNSGKPCRWDITDEKCPYHS